MGYSNYGQLVLVWLALFLQYRYGNEVQLCEVTKMVRLYSAAHRLWNDVQAQDMIEYALLAAALAVVVAGFLPPQIMPAVSTIFSKVISGFNAS